MPRPKQEIRSGGKSRQDADRDDPERQKMARIDAECAGCQHQRGEQELRQCVHFRDHQRTDFRRLVHQPRHHDRGENHQVARNDGDVFNHCREDDDETSTASLFR